MSDKHSDKGNNGKTTTDPTSNLHDPSRRRFLKNTGMVAGGVVGGSLLGSLLTNQFATETPPKTDSQQETANNYQEARQFFSRLEDFKVLEAATERIYPEDDNGPGAIGLGVPYFIDKQLAGPWGMNARDYRHAPFIKYDQVESMRGKSDEKLPPNQQGAQGADNKPETELQRDQSRLMRREIFLQGIRRLNTESQKRFKVVFNEAEEEQQIELLQDMESGKIKMKGVASENFFILLRLATLEGAYSDPLYGGNRNMAGWKMKEFPGAQASYTNVIEKDEFAKLDPISLNNYQGH
ncbi:gluconate 2-dehydrogenase subunit 3 family protein [Virgibacillus sp. SK37]|uniref:gluconate 2-dehydrogenase subunit 3 family protein n=1 Tax=Virgibacillus sp. SK37 TaxID=403957 RepID=UPI0004D18E5D|nr:gluconate 2-dehydrogenase subunit 3 family protein [Virgibacillus sp. SK37]AIF44324.1 dehydrogenase [Virgibacillus sp. SK37]